MHIFVTGATGQQGGAVARQLVERGHRVKGMTRDPASPAARELEEEGIQVVRGDFDDPASIQAAAEGTDAAFVMGTPYEKGPDAEIQQGIAAIDAVAAAGVKHIVYSSVADADSGTGIPHFESKARIEEHLRHVGVPYTIVAPVFFRENLKADWITGALKQGKFMFALPPDRALQTVEVREIGAVVADAFEAPERFAGQRINLASDESTPTQMAQAIAAASGTAIDPVPVSPADTGSDDMAKMFTWFDEQGYTADIDNLRSRHPTVPWRNMDAWAQAQDWGFLKTEAPQAR